VGKSIVFEGKMGMRKFWSVALPFGKVACAGTYLRYCLSSRLCEKVRTNSILLFY
jgi:hypothetical protein